MMIPPSLIDAVERAVAARKARRAGLETAFLCPAHDDHDPSALWNLEKHVWHCPVCGTSGGAYDLAKRLDIELPHSGGDGLTVADLAAAKALSAKFLHALGVRDGKHFGTPCVVIPYDDARGETVAERRRLALAGARFRWRRGDKVVPYGLSRLGDARSIGSLIFVEGESDAWTCWDAGIPALGVPGASTWRDEWTQHVAGIATVAVWREPDAGGDTLAAKVAATLPDVRIIDAPDGTKDPSALWLQLGGDVERFRERMRELAQSARPASELRAEALTKDAREALKAGRAILDADDPLTQIEAALCGLGYAGDTTPPMLAYMAITSRLTERPINLAFVASSASGKSYAVDTALRLMPASAYHLMKAGSPRALVYDAEADYQHRTIVIGEADSISEDGPAASAIRSIASDNRMSYDVVERDERTKAFATRHIDKVGPTGLITTSTRPLPPQMDTRVLTVSVPDTADYTREVLRAAARRKDGSVTRVFDAEPFQATQRWLELAGDRSVVIPFAQSLADAVPASAVRMRRDFGQLLTMIETVALLRQRRRRRDDGGRIVATGADYEAARSLMLDVFTTAATEGISLTVRETTETVARLTRAVDAHAEPEPVTVQRLADALHISKGSASRRWQRAAKLGYVVNRETQAGQPAKLVPGAPLPDDTPALPVWEVLCVPYSKTCETAQQLAGATFEAESAGGVAAAIAPPAQPIAQPGNRSISTLEQVTAAATVARLQANPGEQHTTPAAAMPGAPGSDRCWCGALASDIAPSGHARCLRHMRRTQPCRPDEQSG